MPDTFTPNYNLVMPGIGGDVNTWGTLLNNNFSIIDTGMAANLDLAGTRTMTGNLHIKKTSPAISMVDSSQTLPAGAWQLQSVGNNLQLIRNTAVAGDFSTSTVPMSFNASDAVSFLGALSAASSNISGNETVGANATISGKMTCATGQATNGLTVPGAGIAYTPQGLYVVWNEGTTTGATSLVNNQGGGPGGFIFRNVNSTNTIETGRVTISGAGDITATGNVTAYSDERLKTAWKELAPDFIERAAQATIGTYESKLTGERQAGTVAQDWLTILGEVVGLDAHTGMHTMAYGNAALVLACALARRVLALEARMLEELK